MQKQLMLQVKVQTLQAGDHQIFVDQGHIQKVKAQQDQHEDADVFEKMQPVPLCECLYFLDCLHAFNQCLQEAVCSVPGPLPGKFSCLPAR